jgi:hypothetical protein
MYIFIHPNPLINSTILSSIPLPQDQTKQTDSNNQDNFKMHDDAGKGKICINQNSIVKSSIDFKSKLSINTLMIFAKRFNTVL